MGLLNKRTNVSLSWKNRHTHHHLHKSSGEIALAMLCQQSLAVHHKPPVKTTQLVAISRFAGFQHKPTIPLGVLNFNSLSR